jgi:hypothetical protein
MRMNSFHTKKKLFGKKNLKENVTFTYILWGNENIENSYLF